MVGLELQLAIPRLIGLGVIYNTGSGKKARAGEPPEPVYDLVMEFVEHYINMMIDLTTTPDHYEILENTYSIQADSIERAVLMDSMHALKTFAEKKGQTVSDDDLEMYARVIRSFLIQRGLLDKV